MPEKGVLKLGDALHEARPRQVQSQFPNVTDAIYDALWRKIVNLEVASGERLSDETLAREFGVSRTPVREALYRLSQVGLVQINARRGFFVTQLTADAASELYDIRTALEVFATVQATPLISDADLAPIRGAQEVARERADSASVGDAGDFVTSDLKLHEMIVGRLGNAKLRQLLTDTSGQLSITVLRLALTQSARLAAIEEHDVLIEAIAAGDAQRAGEAMFRHIQNVKERSLEAFFRDS
jgi:DNA-binding GntR family transcriptional regulator